MNNKYIFLSAHLNFAKVLISLTYLVGVFTYAQTQLSVAPLVEGQGYLLINLDIKAENAQMLIRDLTGSKLETKIDLIQQNGKWLIKPLHTGTYQVVRVEVPYFDLPYLKNTDSDDRWRFKIIEKSLSYFGRLEIAKERTEKNVEIRRLNRIITDLPDLQRDLKDLVGKFPIKNGTLMRDDFSSSVIDQGNNNAK